jgi:hypothetical protein
MDKQFIRIKGCGVTPKPNGKHWNCIEGVTAEAGRVPGTCNHVAKAERATLIYGVSPLAVAREATEIAARARDKRGRPIHSSWPTLFAGVTSYPVKRTDVKASSQERDNYQRWLSCATAFLQVEFGDRLKSVVEHVDEGHFHIHFFVVPRLLEDGQIDKTCHPGHRAKLKAAQDGQGKKQQDREYRVGMRSFLDRFYDAVGVHFGHARVGERRKHVSRQLHKVNKFKAEEEKRLEAKNADLERKRMELEERKAEIEARSAASAATQEAEWHNERMSYQNLIRNLTEEKNAMRVREERLMKAHHEQQAIIARQNEQIRTLVLRQDDPDPGFAP